MYREDQETQDDRRLPCLAVVGRPNVGKSTLFNRLCRRSIALVYNEPGVTRDCRRERIHFYGFEAELMDTPGLMDTHSSPDLFRTMEYRTWDALQKADGILFLIDGKMGILPADEDLARQLKKSGKPVWIVVNKMESYRLQHQASEAYSLGFSQVFPISAEHGDGLSDLSQSLLAHFGYVEPVEEKRIDLGSLPPESANEEAEKRPVFPLRLAILGRPNVGKSTLFNHLLGQEHQLVDDQPGITRDSVSIPFTYQERCIHLMDTAGIRRRTQIQEPIERLAVQQAQQAVQHAHVIVLVIDGPEMVEKIQAHQQDIALAVSATEQGKPLIIAVNKVDALPNRTQFLKTIPELFESSLYIVKKPHVIGISAKTGWQVDRLMQCVQSVEQKWQRRFATSALNSWFQEAVSAYPPPATAGSRPRLKYVSQIRRCPPTFLIHGTRTFQVPDAYTRYLTKHFQEHFEMEEVPVRLLYRKIHNPYDPQTPSSKRERNTKR